MRYSEAIDSIFLFGIILFSGLGISFYRSPLGWYTLAFAIFLFIKKRRIPFYKPSINAVIVWLLYAAIVGALHEDFSPLFIVSHIILLALSMAIFHCFGTKIFQYYSKIIYQLSICSLLFWIWNILNVSSLTSFMRSFGLDTYRGRAFVDAGTIYKSIFVYTYTNMYPGEGILPRNYGFCWEPGPFSIFLVLAILFNIARDGFRIRVNKVNVVLFLALITTQSITGFAALLGMIIYTKVQNRKNILKGIMIISLIIIGIVVADSSFPFFKNKIIEQINSGVNIDETIKNSADAETAYSGGRFGGLVIAWHDLQKRPFLGYGDRIDLSYGAQGGSRVFSVNGLASIASIYGLFGLTIVLVYMRRSSFIFYKQYSGSKPYALFIVLLIGLASFSIYRLAIIFSLIFFSINCLPSKQRVSTRG